MTTHNTLIFEQSARPSMKNELGYMTYSQSVK